MAKKIRKIVSETEDWRRVAVLEGTEIHIYDEVPNEEENWVDAGTGEKWIYPKEIYAIMDIIFAIAENPEEYGEVMAQIAGKLG